MKLTHFIIAVALATVTNTAAFGQMTLSSPRSFKSTLAERNVAGARVTVHESSDISAMLNRTNNLEGTKIRGYRVRIFFDNSQQARHNAQAVMTRFKTSFPDIPVYMVYENPYFKVAAGNCLTMDEAMIIWGRVKEEFDRAYVAHEDLPLKNFIALPEAETTVTEGTTTAGTEPTL